MKLSELRKIIDRMDDNANEDFDVVLDIAPSEEEEYLVDLGSIYESKMHPCTIKIEPEIELDTHKVPKRMLIETAILSRAAELKCPNCRKKVGRSDRYCKQCGQPLYTAGETRETLRDEARDLRKRRKLVRMHERADKRAARVARQLQKKIDKEEKLAEAQTEQVNSPKKTGKAKKAGKAKAYKKCPIKLFRRKSK